MPRQWRKETVLYYNYRGEIIHSLTRTNWIDMNETIWEVLFRIYCTLVVIPAIGGWLITNYLVEGGMESAYIFNRYMIFIVILTTILYRLIPHNPADD